MTSLFRLIKVSKHYPILSGLLRRHVGQVKALEEISFELQQGEILGLVGESGSGKSTLAYLLLHLTSPTSGEVLFEEKNLFSFSSSELAHFRKKVQMVFQNPYQTLNPKKSIYQILLDVLSFHTPKGTVPAKNRIEETLELVGLSKDLLANYPHQFSGGQQQRIALARALLSSPQVLILDEALSALDLSIQAQILNLLYELKKKLSLTYLFISHDLQVVNAIADRVIVLDKGKKIEEGPTEKVFKFPEHPITKKLLGNFSH